MAGSVLPVGIMKEESQALGRCFAGDSCESSEGLSEGLLFRFTDEETKATALCHSRYAVSRIQHTFNHTTAQKQRVSQAHLSALGTDRPKHRSLSLLTWCLKGASQVSDFPQASRGWGLGPMLPPRMGPTVASFLFTPETSAVPREAGESGGHFAVWPRANCCVSLIFQAQLPPWGCGLLCWGGVRITHRWPAASWTTRREPSLPPAPPLQHSASPKRQHPVLAASPLPPPSPACPFPPAKKPVIRS
jgi:hypothetical protein